MLAKLGCSYVVVGHSERREHHAENDATVNAKAKKALEHSMTPIVCVGEGLEVRQDGRHVEHTRRAARRLAGRAERRAGRPAWSSPTSRCGRSAPARSRRRTTRRRSAPRSGPGSPRPGPRTPRPTVRILYGGSVKAANVAGIMEKTDVDGCLVGGASLQPDEFGGICRFYDMPVI